MKPLYLLPNPVRKSINQLTLHGKKHLVGSNSLRGMLYANDFDVSTELHEPLDKIIDMLINSLSPHNGVWITEFKCGFKNGKKLVWSFADLVHGEKRGVSLKKALMQRKRGEISCKVDAIVLNGNRLEEVSVVYLIALGKQQNWYAPTNDDLLHSLENDVKEFSSTNSMKALKRLYSIYQIDGQHKSQMVSLESFFNSCFGLLNKIISSLELLKTARQFVPPDICKANEDLLRAQLGTLPQNIVPNALCKSLDVPKLKQILNKHAKDFLRKVI
jgi:hypothetical protein